METLFVLRKKFHSGRVVRKIYEFADERKYWMNKYRYVINNGICKYFDMRLYYDYKRKGVKTFRLMSEKRDPRERNLLGRGYEGLFYGYQKEILWDTNGDTEDIIYAYAQMNKRDNMYRRWEQRCENARKCAYNNAYDINRVQFLGHWELGQCLEENGVSPADIPKNGVQRIQMLMKI